MDPIVFSAVGGWKGYSSNHNMFKWDFLGHAGDWWRSPTAATPISKPLRGTHVEEMAGTVARLQEYVRSANASNSCTLDTAVVVLAADPALVLSNVVRSQPREYCPYCPANHKPGKCPVFEAKKNSANAQGVGAAFTRYVEAAGGKNVMRNTQSHGIQYAQQLAGCHIPAYASKLVVGEDRATYTETGPTGRLAVKAKKALEAAGKAANVFPPKIHVAPGVKDKDREWPGKSPG